MNPHLPPGPGGPVPPFPPPPQRRLHMGWMIAVVAGCVLVGGVLVGSFVFAAPRLIPFPTEDETPVKEDTQQAEAAPSPTPEEPSSPPEEDPGDLPGGGSSDVTAQELAEELDSEYTLGPQIDVTDEACTPFEDEPLACVQAISAEHLLVIEFDSAAAADVSAIGIAAESDGDADARVACHFVLLWYDDAPTPEDERSDIVTHAESYACEVPAGPTA